MITPESARYSRGLTLAILFDAVALGVFYYLLPTLRRPLEVLLAILAVLCALTAFAAGPRPWRDILVSGTAVFLTLFCLELGQKYVDLAVLWPRQPASAAGQADSAQADPWSWKTPVEYLEVKRRAIAEGLLPPDDFAGDIFAGMDKSKLVVNTSVDDGFELGSEAVKPFRRIGPLGWELTPGNRMRAYNLHRPTGTMLFDSAVSINEYGFRETRGNPDSDEVYIFLGCSLTFGYGLSDDQTMPHYFSEALNFEKRVINLAVSGYGVHQALRELETDYHASRAGVKPQQVKGVFFGFFDGHMFRMDNPRYTAAPYYVLQNGRPVYAGSYAEHMGLSGSSRLHIMLERSRLYPFFRERLGFRRDRKIEELRETTLAMLGEMNRLCRERYGVPLTIVYWRGHHQPTLDKFAEWGMPVIKVEDVFAARGDYKAVKYRLSDGHPAAYANEVLGRYIYGQIVGK